MNMIIYGQDKPKIGFKQSPDGSVSFPVENARVIRLKKEQENITWEDLHMPLVFYQESKEILTQMFQQFIEEEIATLTSTEAEKKFLLDY